MYVSLNNIFFIFACFWTLWKRNNCGYTLLWLVFSRHSITFLSFIYSICIACGSFIFTVVLNYFVIKPQFYSIILALQIWVSAKNGHLCLSIFLIIQIVLLWTFFNLVYTCKGFSNVWLWMVLKFGCTLESRGEV